MSLRTVIIFLIITIGNWSCYHGVKGQFNNSATQTKSDEMHLSLNPTTKMDQSQQHPNSLFKDKKDFINLAEQHIKNHKIYNYKQYKPHDNPNKTETFDKEYVHRILISLGLLPVPITVSSTTESMVSPDSKYPASKNNFTSVDIEATTTINFTTSVFNNKTSMNLTELSHFENLTTSSSYIGGLTTEVEYITLFPTTTEIESETKQIGNFSIFGTSTENYSQNLTDSIGEESESESSTGKKVIVYKSTTEKVPITASSNAYNLNMTNNSLDVDKFEEITKPSITTADFKDVYPTEELSNLLTTGNFDLKNDTYERTTSSNFDDLYNKEENSVFSTTKSSDIIPEGYENSTTLQFLAEKYESTTLYESMDLTDSTSPSVQFPYLTFSTSETYSEKANILASENSSEKTIKPMPTSELVTETVTEDDKSSKVSDLAQSILDTTYERFEPITSISFNEVTTEIFETATKTFPYSGDTSAQKTDRAATEKSYASTVADSLPLTTLSSNTQTLSVDINEATTELFLPEAMRIASIQEGTTDTIKPTDRSLEANNEREIESEETTTNTLFVLNKLTTNVQGEVKTDYYLKSEGYTTEISSGTTISYNRTNIPTLSSNRTYLTEKIKESQINEKRESANLNRKAKKFKYATDVMPSLGDYDL